VKRTIAALFSVLFASSVNAQEQIKSYDEQIQINRDGSIDVTENITVHAEGNQIRRGIYRDFPTRYQDRFGNRVTVQLKCGALRRMM